MSGVNKVILIGNVGSTPEVHYFDEDRCVAKISVATSENVKTKSGGYEEQTQWHRVEVFGPAAKFIAKYIDKGDKLYVEGSLVYETYEKDGETKYVTKVKSFKVEALSSISAQKEPAEQEDEW